MKIKRADIERILILCAAALAWLISKIPLAGRYLT